MPGWRGQASKEMSQSELIDCFQDMSSCHVNELCLPCMLLLTLNNSRKPLQGCIQPTWRISHNMATVKACQ